MWYTNFDVDSPPFFHSEFNRSEINFIFIYAHLDVCMSQKETGININKNEYYTHIQFHGTFALESLCIFRIDFKCTQSHCAPYWWQYFDSGQMVKFHTALSDIFGRTQNNYCYSTDLWECSPYKKSHQNTVLHILNKIISNSFAVWFLKMFHFFANKVIYSSKSHSMIFQKIIFLVAWWNIFF